MTIITPIFNGTKFIQYIGAQMNWLSATSQIKTRQLKEKKTCTLDHLYGWSDNVFIIAHVEHSWICLAFTSELQQLIDARWLVLRKSINACPIISNRYSDVSSTFTYYSYYLKAFLNSSLSLVFDDVFCRRVENSFHK